MARRLPPHEIFNAVTHFVGLGLAVVGLVVLLVLAEGALGITAFSLYGSTLILLYLMSALYHILPSPGAKRVFRRLDQTAIFLLIAGTYTPPALLLFGDWLGWTVVGVAWALAAAGVALAWVLRTRSKWPMAGLYLGMGWLGLLGVKPLLETVPVDGLAWLLAGGLLYSVGAVLYATRVIDPWPRYVGAHGVWHLFVLAASAAHFVFMVAYVA